MPTIECHDTHLVAESLEGNRDAFRQIVERYQTLICSLAYSATGNLSRSEDIAQETFLAAWRQLQFLREPSKLRAWLCGIARHRIQKNYDRDEREPAHNAAPLENVQNSPAVEALPSEQAISREQEEILWRSLKKIPELYREPLILYYRENCSIEQVALELDLTEDAVKKRLSRGRNLLQDEVQAFMESILRRTAPDQTFSGAVLAMLPWAVRTAVGPGAGAKGTAAAKSGFFSSWLLPLAPFLGIAAGIGAQWLIIRSTTADRKDRLRQIILTLIFWFVYLGLAVLGESVVNALGRHFGWSARIRFVSVISFWWLFLLISVAFLTVILQRAAVNRRARVAAGELSPPITAPLKQGTLALVVAGAYLMFAWAIRLTWNTHDFIATGIAAGSMLVLALWSFYRLRGRPATEIGPALGLDLILMGLIVLTILNLRAYVWVASFYGVSVAEAHDIQPIWIIHVYTFALIVWTALITILTKRRL